jgi:hypothetical protein
MMPCVVAAMKALFSVVAERVGGAKMHVQIIGMTSCIVDSDSSNNSSRADISAFRFCCSRKFNDITDFYSSS